MEKIKPYDKELVKELMGKSIPALTRMANPSYTHKFELYLALTSKVKFAKKIKNLGHVRTVINALRWDLEKFIPEAQLNALSATQLAEIGVDVNKKTSAKKKTYVTSSMLKSSWGNDYRNSAIGAC